MNNLTVENSGEEPGVYKMLVQQKDLIEKLLGTLEVLNGKISCILTDPDPLADKLPRQDCGGSSLALDMRRHNDSIKESLGLVQDMIDRVDV